MLGFEPEYTTAEAFADFAASRRPRRRVAERAVDGLAAPLPDPRAAGSARG